MAGNQEVPTLRQAAVRKPTRSGLRALAFLVLALVAAVGSALLLTRYMEARTAAMRVPTQKVVVASLDLPVGTEIKGEHLRVVDWPAASLPQGAFAEPGKLEGKVVSGRLVKDEPILPSKLAGSPGSGLAALLPEKMRAVAVRVDDVVGVAGFIHPGDSVDVIVTMRPEGTGTVSRSKVILQNIKVLAVGKDLDSGSRSEKAVQATVATLMVDSGEAEHLALAAANGKLLLALRSAADTEEIPTTGVTSALLVAGPAVHVAPASEQPARPAGRTARKSVAPPAPAPSGEVVEVIRGNMYERRDFQKEAKR